MSTSQFPSWNTVRRANDERAQSNREYIGGLYFLVALGMVQFTIGIGIIQSYTLPLKRFESLLPFLGSTRIVTCLYIFLLTCFYFLVSVPGGLTGFIVASGVLTIWATALLILAVIRYVCESDQRGATQDQDAVETTMQQDETMEREMQDVATADADAPPPLPVKDDKEVAPHEGWSIAPLVPARGQVVSFCLGVTSLIVNLGVMLIIIFAWDIAAYQVVQQLTETAVDENSPQLTMKAIQFMYAYPEVASDLQLNIYVKLLTEWCGKTHNTVLADSEKTEKIKEQFIDAYNINMSIYLFPDYRYYNTTNEWFARRINPAFRPLPLSPNAILAPADARTLLFRTVADSVQWFKGVELNYKELIGNVKVEGSGDYFSNSAVVISRLAPEDYHRFHSPVDAVVTHYSDIPGTYWSVGADAVRSGNNVLLNLRKVLILDAGPTIGKIAYVAIGATCVGAVTIEDENAAPIREGTSVRKGQQLGIMRFGGSTIVMLMRTENISFDTRLMEKSRIDVETLAYVNSEIASSL